MSALRAADTSLTSSNTVFDRGDLGSSVTSPINAPYSIWISAWASTNVDYNQFASRVAIAVQRWAIR